MCELLAVSTSSPTPLTFSLRALASRGAETGTMRDGWGVAYFQGSDVALFREPKPAAESELVLHLETHGPATSLAIAHIRHATQGSVTLANTQPFVRELWGVTHCFAHNGNLKGISSDIRFALSERFQPVGETDSEYAFCALMSRIHALGVGNRPPSMEVLYSAIRTFASELTTLGPANFLYSDARALFAHGHRRIQKFTGQIEPPGLWILERHCPIGSTYADGNGEKYVIDSDQSVIFVASVPLTDEAWIPLNEGELIVVCEGQQLNVFQPKQYSHDGLEHCSA